MALPLVLLSALVVPAMSTLFADVWNNTALGPALSATSSDNIAVIDLSNFTSDYSSMRLHGIMADAYTESVNFSIVTVSSRLVCILVS